MKKLIMIGLLFSQLAAASSYNAEIRSLESRYHLPDGLLSAIVENESSFNPNAINPAGRPGVAVTSYGLGQITLDTGKSRCGLQSEADLLDPHKNLRCAAKILDAHMSRLKGAQWAIAAYNAGEPCVCTGQAYERFGRVCKKKCDRGYFLNQKYVDAVMTIWSARLSQ